MYQGKENLNSLNPSHGHQAAYLGRMGFMNGQMVPDVSYRDSADLCPTMINTCPETQKLPVLPLLTKLQ